MERVGVGAEGHARARRQRRDVDRRVDVDDVLAFGVDLFRGVWVVGLECGLGAGLWFRTGALGASLPGFLERAPNAALFAGLERRNRRANGAQIRARRATKPAPARRAP